jgi:hypothetical protein
MTRAATWTLTLAAGLILLVLVLLLLLHLLLGRDGLRAQLQQRAEATLGLPVSVQSLGLGWWNGPALQIEGLRIHSQPVLELGQLHLRPGWTELLRGRVVLEALAVRNASLPWAAMQSLAARLGRLSGQAATGPNLVVPMPRRVLGQGLRLIGTSGQTVVLDAQAQLAEDGWPDALELSIVQGRLAGSRLQLTRQTARRWMLQLAVAGGTVQGQLQWLWPERAGVEHVISAQLQTKGVEVAQLTAPQPTREAWARQPLSGRLQAQTTLQARTRQLGSLLEALQTQSRFTVEQAVLHGVDLVKAVQTVGVSRGGQTALDTLAGQVTTRGKTVELHNLVASSGVLGATGQVQISPKQELSGRVQVSLGGAVGVPLRVDGTVEEPQVSLTAGAKIGAAIGTLLMPGVGTGAGASVGGRLGELLGK